MRSSPRQPDTPCLAVEMHLDESHDALDAALRSRLGFDDDSWLDLAREATAPSAEPGGPGLLGPYRLLGEAGRGSQGVVYKAIQPGTGRVVAIKKLRAGALAGHTARARFEREIEAVAALSHPGIVPLYSAETTGTHPMIVMEWVEGEPLDVWAAGESLRARLGVFVTICDAVAHAHQRGVIHRDLKPANIMIARDGTPRVMDFGLAKLDRPGSGELATLATSFVGTPAYASPEQVAGGSVDTRGDVYALGVILYELCAGRLPFAPDAPLAELFDQIRLREPTRPSLAATRHAVPRDADAIVLQAMAKEPDRRYQSVEALAADVRRFLAGHAVLAHPPSLAYEARKFVRRHVLACVLGAMAIASIAVLALVSTWQAVRLGTQDAALARSLDAEKALRAVADDRADEAAHAKAKADHEREYAKAEADFMQDMLASLGEAIQRGDRAPARAMLQEAAARLDSRDAYAAPIEIRLRRQLSSLMHRVDVREQARQQLDRAWALCQTTFPHEHEETARTILLRGFIAESDRDLTSAEALYRESAEIFECTLGRESAEYALALNNLACALKDLHRFDEARRLHEHALAIRLANFGAGGREVAMSLRNLGTTAVGAGRLDEAEGFYERALAACAAGFSTPDDVSGIRLNIGRLRLAQKRYADAESIFRALLDESLASRGELAVGTGRILGFLANAYAGQGKPRDAMLATDRQLAAYEAVFEEAHPYRSAAMVAAGRRRIDAGEPARAEGLLRRAAELRGSAEPLDEPGVRSAYGQLLRCLHALGRDAEADAVKAHERAALDRAKTQASTPK